jgi:hypothetical protein
MTNDKNWNSEKQTQNKNDNTIPRTVYPNFIFELLIRKISKFYHSAKAKSYTAFTISAKVPFLSIILRSKS